MRPRLVVGCLALLGASTTLGAGAAESVVLTPQPSRLELYPDAPPVVAVDYSRHTERWTVTPQVSLSETYSDNLALATPGLARRGWASDLAPGVHMQGNDGIIKGTVDYRFHELVYSGQPQLNNSQHALSSMLTGQLVQGWLFIDTVANISQQNISAFGPATSDAASTTTNRTQTGVFQVSPYIRGMISGTTAYELRYAATDEQARDTSVARTHQSTWNATIRSGPSSGFFRWAFDANRLAVRNPVLGERTDDRVHASAGAEVLPQFYLSLLEGHETTDVAGPRGQSGRTPGVGLEWAPNERLRLAALEERRFFGRGHSIELNYRTRLTAWKYTDTADVASLPNLIASSGQGSIYSLMTDLLAGSLPDPVARSQAVQARLDQTGIAPNAPVSGGYVTSSLFINRSRQASAAMLGTRNTVALTFNRTEQQNIGANVGLAGDLVQANADIVQTSYSASWSHRLTPSLATTAVVTHLSSRDVTNSSLQSTQHSQSLMLSSQVSPGTIASIGVRQVRFDSTLNGGYREHAAVVSLSIRF